jgi:hypothetical protein
LSQSEVYNNPTPFPPSFVSSPFKNSERSRTPSKNPHEHEHSRVYGGGDMSQIVP